MIRKNDQPHRISQAMDVARLSNITGDVRMSPYEIRPISCELGLLTSVDGSARFVQGASQVIAAVTGPAQPRYSRHEQGHVCSLEVVVDTTSRINAEAR